MRNRSVLLSMMSSVIYQIAVLVSNFIVVRLIIVYYGSKTNGLNNTFINIINYLSIIEAGIALSATYKLYHPLVHNDWPSINLILSTAKRLYKSTAIIFMFIVIIVAIIYPLFIDYTGIGFSPTYLILILGFSSILEYTLNGHFRVLLMSDQKSYVVNNIQTFTLIISTIIKIQLILSGFMFIYVQLLSAIAVLLRYTITKVYIRSKYKLSNYNLKPQMNILNDRFSIIGHQISGLIVFNSAPILLTSFLGLNITSVYSVYALVFNAIVTTLFMFSKSSVSSFGNLMISENDERTSNVFDIFQSVFFTFGFWFYSVTAFLIIPFIKLYTNGIDDTNYIIEYLDVFFIVIGILNMIRIPSNILIEAKGHYAQTKNRAYLEATINLVVSLILIKPLGIYSVMVGSLASFTYRSIDIILYSKKHFFQKDHILVYFILLNLRYLLFSCYLVLF
ncbi:similar to O antigen flippase Wzx [Paracholeplasma brassicae]|uniref:Similar to O antigen flippase Wzx n=1 Tax=Acholeplasma brassicae TaxID=61635 RepID=U4KM16_9MOLU|nr:hypothetical protein [Paracholeplasma brassicae]CCV65107.1 similar to O antigen flippase Wzx [Paracholeplasma brassicae]